MATACARMKYDVTSSRAERTFELRTVSVNLGSAITARMPMMLITVTSSITVNARRRFRMRTPGWCRIHRRDACQFLTDCLARSCLSQGGGWLCKEVQLRNSLHRTEERGPRNEEARGLCLRPMPNSYFLGPRSSVLVT